MNPEDLKIQREWGFLPPEGEEWPPEVALTVTAIERQDNPFFSVLVDVARMIHHSGNLSDLEADEAFMQGKVDLMTDMVVSYCWHQLGGRQPAPEELAMLRVRARAVVGQLLLHVSERREAI